MIELLTRLCPKNFRQILVKQINPLANENILNFGTGTGEVAILLKKEMPTVNIIGIDVDLKVLAIAEKRYDGKIWIYTFLNTMEANFHSQIIISIKLPVA